MNKKILRNKSGEKFSAGIFVILLSISISLFAFITEESKITGFATLETNQESNISELAHNSLKIIPLDLIKFKEVNSLSTLSSGYYYIDEKGIVYWADDESRPAIAQLNFVEEAQKNRHIYIDDSGRIGYILSEVSISEQQ